MGKDLINYDFRVHPRIQIVFSVTYKCEWDNTLSSQFLRQTISLCPLSCLWINFSPSYGRPGLRAPRFKSTRGRHTGLCLMPLLALNFCFLEIHFSLSNVLYIVVTCPYVCIQVIHTCICIYHNTPISIYETHRNVSCVHVYVCAYINTYIYLYMIPTH